MTTQKFGRYQIKKEIGRGGMATVYLAHDPRFMRDVALKAMPHQFTHDPMFRTRFEREAQAIAALEHRAIVPVHDFGEEDGQPFIVMRYMAGGSLSDKLKDGNLSLPGAAIILERIASALDRAHEMGIIHRDLKPGNILFDQYGDAYLADFGIAKITEATAALTGSSLMGTPTYMSPEQVQGEKIDGRSDIYSLGIILYEMLAGTQPYQATTPWGILSKHVNAPIPSILDKMADLPPQIDTIVKRALAKEAYDRFQTAGELATAVTLVAQQRPLPLTSPETTPEPDTEMADRPSKILPITEPEGGSEAGLEKTPAEPGETAAEPKPSVEDPSIVHSEPAPDEATLNLPALSASETVEPLPHEMMSTRPEKEIQPPVPRWIGAFVIAAVLILLIAGLFLSRNRDAAAVPSPAVNTDATAMAGDALPAETVSDFIQAKWEDAFRLTDLGYGDDVWAAVMSQNSPYGRQTWKTFIASPTEAIQAKWEEGFRVTSLAFGDGVWAVVMSQDTPYGRQIWKTSADFPSDYIQANWAEGFRVTDLAYGNNVWGVIMSQEGPYGRQIWKTSADFPSAYIQANWEEGFRVTSLAFGDGVWAVVMSQDAPYGRQSWRTLADLPGTYISDKWAEGFRVTSLAYGNGVWAVVLSQESPYGRQTWRVLPDF